jgi:hypothetical protein
MTMKKILSLAAAFAVVVFPIVAWAQEVAAAVADAVTPVVAPATVEPKSDIFWTVMQFFLPLMGAALVWLKVKLIAWIQAKTKNEMIAGMLARLADSVVTLVREAEQTTVAAIKAAKDPKSPGGVNLTKAEAENIKAAVIAKFKEIWGVKGLAEAGKVLGLSEDGLLKFISAKVESAVLAESNSNP